MHVTKFFEITASFPKKENSLTKKFAFTSRDSFKGDFLLNSKRFNEDTVLQTYLSMRHFPNINSKSYFQPDFLFK